MLRGRRGRRGRRRRGRAAPGPGVRPGAPRGTGSVADPAPIGGVAALAIAVAAAFGSGAAAGAPLPVPPSSERSIEVLRLDCASKIGRREVTLFGNGTIRLRDG